MGRDRNAARPHRMDAWLAEVVDDHRTERGLPPLGDMPIQDLDAPPDGRADYSPHVEDQLRHVTVPTSLPAEWSSPPPPPADPEQGPSGRRQVRRWAGRVWLAAPLVWAATWFVPFGPFAGVEHLLRGTAVQVWLLASVTWPVASLWPAGRDR